MRNLSRVILVASGKGGVGKSTFSAACGRSLAEIGQRVLLIDGDCGLRCLDLLFGVTDSVVYDWQDVINGRLQPENALIEIVEEKLCLLPAPAFHEIPQDEAFMAMVRYYSSLFDEIIIDAPAGVGELLKVYSKCAGHAVVVATTDAASVRSAYRIGDVLNTHGIHDTRLIINKVRADLIRSGKNPNLDEIIDKSEIRLIGVVPFSEEITQSATEGRLSFKTDKNVSKAFENIALRLTGKNVKLTKL